MLGLVNSSQSLTSKEQDLVNRVLKSESSSESTSSKFPLILRDKDSQNTASPRVREVEEVEQNLSLVDVERQLIKRALEKHSNRRKDAAEELGISERTLYRKIKEYDLK